MPPAKSSSKKDPIKESVTAGTVGAISGLVVGLILVIAMWAISSLLGAIVDAREVIPTNALPMLSFVGMAIGALFGTIIVAGHTNAARKNGK